MGLSSTKDEPAYFNVPGLQTEQPNFLRMKPHVPFSLAGVLRPIRGQYLFTIPKALRVQCHTCHRIGKKCQKLNPNQRMNLNSDYFSAVLPGHVVCYFISKNPNYTCINRNVSDI